jgi:hypothetical protein
MMRLDSTLLLTCSAVTTSCEHFAYFRFCHLTPAATFSTISPQRPKAVWHNDLRERIGQA